MTDDEMQQLRLRVEAGLRAMSAKDMVRRDLEQAEGMRQRGPLTNDEQEAMRNAWGAAADENNAFVHDTPRPTLFERLKLWLRD